MRAAAERKQMKRKDDEDDAMDEELKQDWGRIVKEWEGKEEQQEEEEDREGDDSATYRLFMRYMEHGVKKNHFGSLRECVIKPVDDVSLWAAMGTEHLEKGHVLDCDAMLDQLCNCGFSKQRRDKYLMALMDMTFGSVDVY